jgi:hypothetical protein
MKLTIGILSVLAAFLTSVNVAFCQQHDKNWIGWGFNYQPIIMGFEDDSISYEVTPDVTKLEFFNGITAISNAQGELQFYTNGNVVISWDGNIMEGGKGFNEGSIYGDFEVNGTDTVFNYAYTPYTYQVIPDAYDGNIYYMIHSFVKSEGGCKSQNAPKLQISKIDMSAQQGRGRVVYKNRYFDEELMGLMATIVRHGNGHDWWVVRRSQDGLSYRSILLQRDSVVQVVQSSINGLGYDWFDDEDCYETSLSNLYPSQDGSRFVDIYGHGWAKLLDFDRCSGEVSLIDTFSTGTTPLEFLSGEIIDCSIFMYEFSPSGRYVYGLGYAELAQWDLEANDIAASKVQLGGVPWALDENQNVLVGISGGAWVFAHGPDGKLYSLVWNAHSVIEHPDEKGEASGLCLAADSPPSCLGVPYNLFSTPHPNYRLGPLPGSGCDTISSAQPPLTGSGYGVTASPTVASGAVEVSITLPGYGSASTAEVQVVDMLGRVLHRHRFPPYAYLHHFEVQDWPSGLYNVVLLEKDRARASTRLVVAR